MQDTCIAHCGTFLFEGTDIVGVESTIDFVEAVCYRRAPRRSLIHVKPVPRSDV